MTARRMIAAAAVLATLVAGGCGEVRSSQREQHERQRQQYAYSACARTYADLRSDLDATVSAEDAASYGNAITRAHVSAAVADASAEQLALPEPDRFACTDAVGAPLSVALRRLDDVLGHPDRAGALLASATGAIRQAQTNLADMRPTPASVAGDGPTLSTLREAAYAASADGGESVRLALAWKVAQAGDRAAADRALGRLEDAWSQYRLLDADSMARDFASLSKGLPDAVRSRLAGSVVQYARTQEETGRLPAGGERAIAARLRQAGITVPQ